MTIGEGCVVWERGEVGLRGAEEGKKVGDEGMGKGGDKREGKGVTLGKNVLVEAGAVVEAESVGEGSVIGVGVHVGRGAVVGKVKTPTLYHLC